MFCRPANLEKNGRSEFFFLLVFLSDDLDDLVEAPLLSWLLASKSDHIRDQRAFLSAVSQLQHAESRRSTGRCHHLTSHATMFQPYGAYLIEMRPAVRAARDLFPCRRSACLCLVSPTVLACRSSIQALTGPARPGLAQLLTLIRTFPVHHDMPTDSRCRAVIGPLSTEKMARLRAPSNMTVTGHHTVPSVHEAGPNFSDAGLSCPKGHRALEWHLLRQQTGRSFWSSDASLELVDCDG